MTAATDFRRLRVLVVDDESLIREMLHEALAGDGFEVELASCGEDAIRHLASGAACDALFTDINLGRGMDGVALSFAARRLRPRLPVIYASGAFSSLREFQAVPGASFLRKPYDPAVASALLHAAAEPLRDLMRA